MRKMAAYCKSIFGTLLQADFLPGDGYDHLPTVLPSPEKLKYKILIKNKKRRNDESSRWKAMCGGALLSFSHNYNGFSSTNSRRRGHYGRRLDADGGGH